jgi:hypothetical protein
LQEKFQLRPERFGALVIVTRVNTLLPSPVMSLPSPEYDTPEIPRRSESPPQPNAESLPPPPP